jgi:diguanylate cyclase (GGDEF)-like protein
MGIWVKIKSLFHYLVEPVSDFEHQEIERRRLSRHDYSIGRLGYLIVILTVFSATMGEQGIELPNYALLSLSFLMLLLTMTLDVLPDTSSSVHLRIFIRTLVYAFFITLAILIGGEWSSPLYYLFYLVVIAASLTLSRRLLILEIVVISVCVLGIGLKFENSWPGSIRFLILKLIPFWALVFFASEIYLQLEDARRQFERLSETDSLTGLFNMRRFTIALETEIQRSDRYQRKFSVLMLDSDNLKSVNDTYGHLEGSRYIRQVADILHYQMRKSDMSARYGGDEFVVLLTETDRENARRVAERIRNKVENTALEITGSTVRRTISIGIATFPSDATGSNDLIRCADNALYESKRRGKNKVSSFDELSPDALHPKLQRNPC